MSRRTAGRLAFAILIVLAAITGCLSGLMLVYSVDLPQIADLEQYRPPATTTLLDVHGQPFGSIALERRIDVSYSGFSPLLREAVISIEDRNFESHWGVNLVRIAGAAIHDFRSDNRSQGASTLTMQLARNLFLSPQRTFRRKFEEILLSIQIERHFTKNQIFDLYANQIYLGQGVYGFEAGARYYFNRHANNLTLPQAALLAALPKGPSYFSPVLHPKRALERRNKVIDAMVEDGAITNAQAVPAKAAPLGLDIQPFSGNVAPYFVAAVREKLDQEFGRQQVQQGGLEVYTTLDLKLQRAADQAVLDGLAAYERKRGWQGNLLNVIAAGGSMAEVQHPDWVRDPIPGSYMHALVTSVKPNQVVARIGTHQVALSPAEWAWTKYKKATDFLKRGDLIYVHILPGSSGAGMLNATLEQDSGAQAALLAIDNTTGEILAMVGGRDFNVSQYNRAMQAERQVGSSFKAYVYTAAMESGMRPTTVVVDSPITFMTPGGPYTPRNFDNTFEGPVTLTHAFGDSRNIPALKVAARIGIRKVIAVAHQFGLTSHMPPYLPVALGAVDATLEQQVSAYSSFPNDGVRVQPHLIRRVVNADDVALPLPPVGVYRSTSPQIARMMMPLFKAVVSYGGTAAVVGELKHPLGGKTGTTDDYRDAWFIGFSPSITCGVWVGYDDERPLGNDETGGILAAPIWANFMRVAIAGKPNEKFPGNWTPPRQNIAGISESSAPVPGN